MRELVASVLTLVVAFLLKLLFVQLKIELDELVFNSIVAGIVTWFMTHLFVNLTFMGASYLRASFRK